MSLKGELMRFLSLPSRCQVYKLKTIPQVWPEMCPRSGETKSKATFVIQKQYFIPWKAQVRIQRHFDTLLKYRILRPCQSSWNTPLLPVQKPGTEDFRPVQDFQAVNTTTVTLYPIVQIHTCF
jgi:hypothetical protein